MAGGFGHTQGYTRLSMCVQREQSYLVILTPVDVGPPSESCCVEDVRRLRLHVNSSTSVNTADRS